MSVITISYGPQHFSGPIRLVLKVDGDIVREARVDCGYMFRWVEGLAERKNYISNIPLIERVANIDAFNISLGYVMALEELMGIEVPERAKYIRTLMGELTRIASHLYDTGIFLDTAGSFTALLWPLRDRELVFDLIEMITGARVTHSFAVPGGVRYDIPQGFRERAEKALKIVERHVHDIIKAFFENEIYQLRLKNVGILRTSDAVRLGAAGPTLRGSNVKVDVRKDEPYAAYDKVDFEVVTEASCDSYGRAMVRIGEILQSISIIRQVLREIPSGPHLKKVPALMSVKEGEAYARVEASRGEAGFYVVASGKAQPYRVKISTASFRNAYVLSHILRDVKVADVPVILFSTGMWPWELDR